MGSKYNRKPLFVLQTYEDRIANKDLSKKLTERLSNLTIENGETTELPTKTPPLPPPPPPLPVNNNNVNNDNDETDRPKLAQSPIKTTTNKKPKAPPVPVKTSTLSSYQQQSPPPAPPPCPTPDYDTLSITSTSSLQRTNNNNNNNIDSKTSQDCVEMDSLESYKLNNSNLCQKTIKPPDIYFNNNINKCQLTGQLSNSSTSSCSSNQSIKQQKQRPISVTIGEYPSGTVRRQPARFDFLQNNNSAAKHPNGCASVTREFASELAQTLNRSNLRKRTESLANGN